MPSKALTDLYKRARDPKTYEKANIVLMELKSSALPRAVKVSWPCEVESVHDGLAV
jgi:hypothetical protein